MNRLARFIQDLNDASPAPRQRLPIALQFPVNDICNSHCQMCHIWQKKRDFELSASDIRKILSNPLYREIENVGINGGEPTLRRDLDEILKAIIDTLPKLQSVSLITNAISVPRVIGAVDELGRICRGAGKRLDVMVSLDGVGEVHDRVRGVSGNFASAVKVVDHLLTTPWVSSRRIGCTIIAENVFGVEDVLEFARSKGIYARFRIGIPHPRLYTGTLSEPFALSAEQRFHVAAFLDGLIHGYEEDPARRAFYRSLRDQVIYERPRAAGCVWRNRGVTLGPRGEFAFCAVASPTLGNTRERPSDALYWENGAILAEIQAVRCATCRHDYDGVGDRRLVVRQRLGRLKRRLPAAIARSVDRLFGVEAKWREWREAITPVYAKGARRTNPSGAILLCGWYGTETLGDRAILGGLRRLIAEELPDVPVEIASLEPYVTHETRRVMPELNVRAVVGLAEAMERSARGDYRIVAVAGGPMMTGVREVLDLKRLLAVAAAAGARTALLGCGLGPLERRGARFFAIRQMIRDAAICVLRDRPSAELAMEFGRRGPTLAGIDPAFFWAEFQSEVMLEPSSRPSVALAWRDWPLVEYAADLPATAANFIKTKFESELVRLVDVLRQRGVSEVIPVCMHTLAVGGDDRAFYRRLFRDRPELGIKVAMRRRTPVEEVTLLRRADAVVAMRFHSCVFSLALKKPFVALDYTRGGKISGLLSDTGNLDRLVSLEQFDGESTARRVLDDITFQRRPLGPDIARAEAVYRDAIRAIAR